MEVNYQKMYAYLVGQVDDALQMIARDLICGDVGQKELTVAGEKLKNALLSAEDMYLEISGE